MLGVENGHGVRGVRFSVLEGGVPKTEYRLSVTLDPKPARQGFSIDRYAHRILTRRDWWCATAAEPPAATSAPRSGRRRPANRLHDLV
jgi:hypothetical protein